MKKRWNLFKERIKQYLSKRSMKDIILITAACTLIVMISMAFLYTKAYNSYSQYREAQELLKQQEKPTESILVVFSSQQELYRLNVLSNTYLTNVSQKVYERGKYVSSNYMAIHINEAEVPDIYDDGSTIMIYDKDIETIMDYTIRPNDGYNLHDLLEIKPKGYLITIMDSIGCPCYVMYAKSVKTPTSKTTEAFKEIVVNEDKKIKIYNGRFSITRCSIYQ